MANSSSFTGRASIICRSPTADGVLRRLVREAGFERVLDMIEAGARGELGELRAALKAS